MDPTKILVVEDEPSIAEVVTLYLKRAGYVATVVRDARPRSSFWTARSRP